MHMEEEEETPIDYDSKVDTSRPFSSVKEAVAIFGERLLSTSGNFYSPKPYSPTQELWKLSSSSSPPPTPMIKKPIMHICDHDDHDDHDDRKRLLIMSAVKKLEEELGETKRELKLLKERESETEIAVATLNAELHKNMSKLAKAEAAAARASTTMLRSSSVSEKDYLVVRAGSGKAGDADDDDDERDYYLRGRNYNIKNTKKMKKLKPIIPLVGDLFSRKRKSGSSSLPLPRPRPVDSDSPVYFG